MQALRSAGCTNIGIASNHAPVHAATDADADVEAADVYDHIVNWTFADPVLLGKYPADELAALLTGPVDDDLAVIAQPLDWFGINYYEPTLIAAPREGEGSEGVLEVDLPPGMPFAPVALDGYPRTDFGWPIVPEGLTEILTIFRDRFGAALPPVYITESGCSLHDPDPDAAGRVRDERRIAYHATISPRSAQRWTPGSTSAAISYGRSSTTSSGPPDTASGSAWCTWTTTHWRGRRRIRTGGSSRCWRRGRAPDARRCFRV